MQAFFSIFSKKFLTREIHLFFGGKRQTREYLCGLLCSRIVEAAKESGCRKDAQVPLGTAFSAPHEADVLPLGVPHGIVRPAAAHAVIDRDDAIGVVDHVPVADHVASLEIRIRVHLDDVAL